ncbi:MAG: hypothetical protein ACI94D_001735, partial [Neolewinella sp.]
SVLFLINCEFLNVLLLFTAAFFGEKSSISFGKS